jgi:hypothetical protein
MKKIPLTKETTSSAQAQNVIEETMENFAELMQRLLEIQSGGRQRTSKLITDDDRATDRFERRTSPEKPPEPLHLGQQ